MTARKEGAGLRAPNSNSLRAEIRRLLTADPTLILSPRALADGFGVNIKTAHNAAAKLRKEGFLTTVVGYQLTTAVKAAPIKPRQPAEPRRGRRVQPSYSEPASRIKGPRVASVFELGEALQRGMRVEA